MRSLSALNLYELLEVSPGAHQDEIERAYRLAAATWADGSLAIYSLFEDSEAAVVRERIRHAYRVLSNRESRRAYDEENSDSQPVAEALDAGEGPASEASPHNKPLGEMDEIEASLDMALDGSLEGDVGADFDGSRLRRARMHRGIELEEVSEITKVSCAYLRFLEEEEFARLPASVYVRGFVTAYARAIGLSPDRVVASYMRRVEATRREQDRGRLLARP